ncbi:MAG: response regulator transcription factor [Gallionella sp.]|nr:response regulator transcription factor [Gallionella sp.]
MAPALNIIVVEDHDLLRQVTVETLRHYGHQVVGLGCAEELDDVAGGAPADIFILDINLPGEDGISLARRIRRANPEVGIIMVTSLSQSQDKVLGFDAGADIYLSKPVETLELLAAVNALARRVKPVNLQSHDTLMLDLARRYLQGPAGEVRVTPSECTLLNALARAPGRQLEYWQIAEALGQEIEVSSKARLEVKIFRLRKKILQAGGGEDAITALRLKGYQLCINLIVR